MLQTYIFEGESPIIFDDCKTVDELVSFAFDEFGYYEPFGMETVTVFQSHHPKSDFGWFTTDKSRKCCEEITNYNELFFAYYLKDVLYYVEGGWGHHMVRLGNHPQLNTPIPLKLKFPDFLHTVVFAGNQTLRKIISLFESVGYISKPTYITVFVIAYPNSNISYKISFDDSKLDMPLSDFHTTLPITEGIITLELTN